MVREKEHIAVDLHPCKSKTPAADTDASMRLYDHLDKRFQDLVPKFLPTGFNHSSIRDSSAGTVYGNNGSEAVEGPTPARDWTA